VPRIEKKRKKWVQKKNETINLEILEKRAGREWMDWYLSMRQPHSLLFFKFIFFKGIKKERKRETKKKRVCMLFLFLIYFMPHP